MSGALVAILPVKAFGAAKRRLAPLLSSVERAQLARLMFEDVLEAMRRAASLAGILVVTADSQARAVALTAGAEVLGEDRDSGLNAAVVAALRELRASACERALIVPADVPALEPRDIDAIAAALGPAPAAALVAAGDGGTNALACSPLDLLAPQFGPGSARRHRAAACARGVMPRMLDLPRVALDVDDPEQLFALLARKSRTRTHAYLANLALEDRLGLEALPAGRT